MRRRATHPPVLVAAAAAVLAALSLLLPHAPGYDPWAWLAWGRELAGGGLDTVDGPAFKPLPVLVDAGLWRLAGDTAAPTLWLLVARTGALAAAGLAGWLAFGLAGRSWTAAALATAGVGLTAGYAWHGAVGNAEGLALASGLLALGFALDGRPRAGLLAGLGLALLRPEGWPLLGLYGLWAARADRGLRPWLAAGSVAVLAAWFVPEWLGSGHVLRSGDRARVPNAGAPATADLPVWAALRVGLGLPLLPLLLLALAAPGRARWPAALGALWLVEVAVMAQLLGTSGEPRYGLPGAALLAVGGAVGAVELARRHGRALATGLAFALLVAGVVRADGAAGELRRAGDEAELTATLPAAIADAGGRERLLACGRPVTGRYRGPMVAWALGVPRRVVRSPAGTGGAVLRSRIRRPSTLQPAPPPGGVLLGASARWRVEGRCARERSPASTP